MAHRHVPLLYPQHPECPDCRTFAEIVQFHIPTIREIGSIGAFYCASAQHPSAVAIACKVHKRCRICDDTEAWALVDKRALSWGGGRIMSAADFTAYQTRVADLWHTHVTTLQSEMRRITNGMLPPDIPLVAQGRAEQLILDGKSVWCCLNTHMKGVLEDLTHIIQTEAVSRDKPWVLAIDDVTEELKNTQGKTFVAAAAHFAKKTGRKALIEYSKDCPESSGWLHYVDPETVHVVN